MQILFCCDSGPRIKCGMMALRFKEKSLLSKGSLTKTTTSTGSFRNTPRSFMETDDKSKEYLVKKVMKKQQTASFNESNVLPASAMPIHSGRHKDPIYARTLGGGRSRGREIPSCGIATARKCDLHVRHG